MTDLKGYCPMGCGQTLIAIAHEGGRIECSSIDCPSPYAVDRILANPTPDHIVTLTADDLTILHPLRERLDGELTRCSLHQHLTAMDRAPMPPGTYRITDADGSWTWTAVPEP
ncbi:DUF6085 family protein [Prescottella equi]|uniref:DUF6085 family protein n=1 Tax=Rhodococcus hoagii TaxID=43767 RepID=UPI000A105343|nr:DUF6085 family protein [Prescottella equi]ORM18322.1 (2Fe-2S)-binding protein [Prescottella equi]